MTEKKKPGRKPNTTPTRLCGVRISEDALTMLDELTRRYGATKRDVLEMAITRLAGEVYTSRIDLDSLKSDAGKIAAIRRIVLGEEEERNRLRTQTRTQTESTDSTTE